MPTAANNMETVKNVPRSPTFIFGSVVFFVGLLLFALGVSKAIVQNFDLLTFVELISGFVLMIVGFRATRPAPSKSS
jgi:uncharacterized membrane protein